MIIAHRVDGKEFELIYSIVKDLFPRNRFEACSLKPTYKGEPTKYTIKLNLTDDEYFKLCDKYIETQR